MPHTGTLDHLGMNVGSGVEFEASSARSSKRQQNLLEIVLYLDGHPMLLRRRREEDRAA